MGHTLKRTWPGSQVARSWPQGLERFGAKRVGNKAKRLYFPQLQSLSSFRALVLLRKRRTIIAPYSKETSKGDKSNQASCPRGKPNSWEQENDAEGEEKGEQLIRKFVV